MAPAGLRFYPPPHRLPPQRQALVASPASSSCRNYFSRSRRQLVCSSSDPRHQPPADEDARLRAEISPSVLRALQPQDASSSPNFSGESLIERNLRKRAKDSSSSSSLEERSADSASASASDDGILGDLYSLPENQVLPATITSGQHLPSPDKSSFPAFGDDERFSRYAISSPCPITAAFWQEKPPGLDIEEFHSLDFFAWYFRLALLIFGLVEDADYLKGISATSLLWLLFPTYGDLSFFSGKMEEFYIKKNVPRNLGKIMDDKDAYSEAIEAFSWFWNSKAWTERAKSGKASEFVLTLAYSAYVFILSGAAGESTSSTKKLEECSVHLNQALTQLHGPPMNPIAIWEQALKGTSFALDGSAFLYDHALIFPCKLKHMNSGTQYGPVLEEVQSCLNKDLKGSDVVVFLQRSSDNQEEFFILIAPWYWILTLDSKTLAPLPAFLCLLSCLATSQFSGAGLDFGFSWEQYAVPLGWGGIVASLYFMKNMQFPTLCPFPSLGAIGTFSSDYGLVSSRSSLISAVLKNSCAPLAVSLLLLVVGWTFWGPSHYNLASVVDFQGYVLAPPDLFSYSGILTKLLQSASVATIQEDFGGAKLAVSPFVLAGLLGLNFTAFTLFPGVRTDGGLLLRSLLKSKNLANQLNLAFTLLLTFILCAKSPLLGLGWVVVSYVTEAECYVKDDVSDIGLVPSVAGAVLAAAALVFFIPPLQ